MSGTSPRRDPLSLFAMLLFALMAAAAAAPPGLAIAAYKSPTCAERLRHETTGRILPFGRIGDRLIRVAGAIGRRIPRCDRERAGQAAQLAATAVLGRLRQALFFWLAAVLSISAACCAGLANRQSTDPTPLWSSPLAGWFAKRSLTVSAILLLAAPLMFAFLPVSWAAYLLGAVALGAAAASYLFTRNLPARLQWKAVALGIGLVHAMIDTQTIHSRLGDPASLT